MPLNIPDIDNIPKGPKCHFLTNVRAGRIWHRIWEEANLNSCHYDPRMILCCHSFMSCCSHFAVTHLFTHPHTRRWIWTKRFILGRDRKSELCISEILAKNVLASALAKKLRSFWKTKALLALLFIFLGGFECNFYCTADTFTIFFYVYSHTKITFSHSLCVYVLCVDYQSWFYALWIRKLSLGRSGGNSSPLSNFFKKLLSWAFPTSVGRMSHPRDTSGCALSQGLLWGHWDEMGSPGAQNIPEVW